MLNRSIVILALSSIALALGSCGPTQKVKRTFALNDLSVRAKRAETAGDMERALELWQEYVERRPHAHFAEYELGRIESELGMYTEAIGHLTTAHDLRPANIQYIEQLADTYIKAGRPDDMMQLMRETVNEGEDGAGYLRLARYARRVGLLDDSKLAIQSAMIYAGTESPEPYIAMADLAKQIGDRDLEINALRQALWFDPASDELNQRFLGLGVIPGPSLALEPTVD